MAYLKIISGEYKGKKFEIDRDEIIIGRATDNVVPIPDPAISSRHCSIVRKGRIFMLKDLNSTNGTRLNGVIIKEYQLSPKDIITVGPIDIQFDGDDIEPATSQPPNHPTGPQVTVKLSSPPSAVPTQHSTMTFAQKKDTKWLWITIFSIIALAILIALAIFLFLFFKVK